ncbi:unnamed protein product [Absidia cylindrospora]
MAGLNIINPICAEELQQGNYTGFFALSDEMQARIKHRIELKMKVINIPIDKAEDQWIAVYFILRYFSTMRYREWRGKEKNKEVQKRKRLVSPISAAATTTPTLSSSSASSSSLPASSSSSSSSSLTPPSSSSGSGSASVKKARTTR